MDKALNETLASLPDDTNVYVRVSNPYYISMHANAHSSLATNTPRAT